MPAPPFAWPRMMVSPLTTAPADADSPDANSQPRSAPPQSCVVAPEPASEATVRDCNARANNDERVAQSTHMRVRQRRSVRMQWHPRAPHHASHGQAAVASAGEGARQEEDRL